MYSSNDTARPLMRLIGLIASVVAFASLWSGDEKVQREIAAARAKSRTVYAGPSVLQNTPVLPRISSQSLARQGVSPVVGLLDRIPQGQYQLFDDAGRVGLLVLETRPTQGDGYVTHVQQSLTIQTSHGQLQLRPIRSVSAAELLYR